MSLSSAKAKLDAQGGDPVTGYISKADHQDSYTELVDDTALTGSTTAEALDVAGALTAGTVASDATVAGTGLAGGLLSSANPVINGTAAPGTSAIPSRQDHVHASDTTKVTGPASATDNALVRFDGTGGKTVQDSGITVNDSGYITSDFVVSKASPVLSVSASTTTTASIYFDNAAAGSYGRFLFRVNGSKRWEFGRDGTAEAGANAGSDFYISNYSDASAAIGIPFKIARSTGKTTLGYVGASAGLELGSSGPRVMSGTGSPEGVVSAPVGSRWIRTDGDTLGDFEYQKRSGTGNTGWVVADGDTGWRNVSSSLQTGWTGKLYVRRQNGVVTIATANADPLTFSAGAAGTVLTGAPTGFGTTYEAVISVRSSTDGAAVRPFLWRSGSSCYYYGSTSSAGSLLFSYTTTTSEAWPSSLPGSAA